MGLFAFIPIIGQVIDKIFPDKEAGAKAKAELMRVIQEGELEHLKAAAETISSEAKSEHWLAAVWRPLTMLVFLGMVVSWWFGYTPANVTESLVLELFGLIKIGLGGYVVGRSGEKIVKLLKTENRP